MTVGHVPIGNGMISGMRPEASIMPGHTRMPGSPAASSLVTDRGVTVSPVAPHGREWIIDARGCPPEALRSLTCLQALFARLVADLDLTPVAPAVWHTFPSPGGITGMVVLAESHLACHSFPEYGSICLNLFCCRPRADFDVPALLAEMLGARETQVRCIDRDYGLAWEAR